MSLKDFILKLRKIIIYKTINLILFSAVLFFIIYFANLKIISENVKKSATQNIKYPYSLLEREYKKTLNLLSPLAILNARKEMEYILSQSDNIYALIFLDKKGNIKRFYNLKKGFYNIKSLEEYSSILKNYKKKIDKSYFFVSPLYPNFLSYPNSFLVGFPYFKNNKQDGYLLAIFDISLAGLLKYVYLFLFSKLDKISFIKYKINYNYFDKPGIKSVNINYEIDENILHIYALRRTASILFGIIAVYFLIILLDFYLIYRNLYKDYKNIILFLTKGRFQCNLLNFHFSKKICENILKIFFRFISKNRKVDLLLENFNLILKENKNIKIILKNISTWLKYLFHCQEISIYIFDIERNISVFSGNNKIINEHIFDKIRKEFKNKNIVQIDGNICIRCFFEPFEIFYVFTNCKSFNEIYNLKNFINVVNIIIITALKFYTNSIQDSLTKTFNREKMKYDILEYLELYKNYKDVFSILMIDIDNLKKINENYSHDAGDIVLQSLVKTIKGLLKKEDVIYRYSGEEFIILLPKKSLKEAIELAEKLRERIMYVRVPYKNKIITFTVSFGVTQVKDSDNLIDLIQRVYKAIQKAKNKGGNRVEYDF